MDNSEFVRKIANSASAYPDRIFAVGEGRVYTCVNPYSYHLVRRHEELYASLDGLFVDGMTMCWLIRLLWGQACTSTQLRYVGYGKRFVHLSE